MKSYLSLFCFFFIPFIFSQVKIEGYVYDVNKEALVGASIYIDGTTIGTTSDVNGNFSLTIPSNINSVLVFSYFGYITKYENIRNVDSILNITLEEDIKELKEVILEQNRFSRKQMLKLFREKFLGTNKAGRNCKILNEDELYFDYDKAKFIFKAYSDKPLIIENKYLNYTVQFQLVDFQCQFYKLSINSIDVINSLYAGTSLFTEMSNDKTSLNRRKKSYEGSSLQLFRNLSVNNWSKDQFLLFEGSFVTNPSEHFKIEQVNDGSYKVNITKQDKNFKNKNFIAEFSLLYENKQQSKITFYTDVFYIDSFGLYTEYNKIYFSGDITNKKVGDMLPSNYGL